MLSKNFFYFLVFFTLILGNVYGNYFKIFPKNKKKFDLTQGNKNEPFVADIKIIKNFFLRNLS